MFMAWDLNHAHQTGQAILVSKETAEWLIQYGEPVQIGLGAIILRYAAECPIYMTHLSN